jgi:hypothetical protein
MIQPNGGVTSLVTVEEIARSEILGGDGDGMPIAIIAFEDGEGHKTIAIRGEQLEVVIGTLQACLDEMLKEAADQINLKEGQDSDG